MQFMFTVVLKLMTGLEMLKTLQLYADNYHSSLKLYNDIGINLWDSPNQKKRFPKSLVKNRKDRGYYNYRSNGVLLSSAWYDRRFVYFLSTLHCGTLATMSVGSTANHSECDSMRNYANSSTKSYQLTRNNK